MSPISSEYDTFFGAGRPSILWLLFASMAYNEAIKDCLAFAMDGVEITNVSTSNREQHGWLKPLFRA